MSKNLVREALELFEDDDNSKSKQKRFLKIFKLIKINSFIDIFRIDSVEKREKIV